MQLFYGPVNKQRNRALDTRNSIFVTANMSFIYTLCVLLYVLKPYVVYICKHLRKTFILSLAQPNYYYKKLHSAPLKYKK